MDNSDTNAAKRWYDEHADNPIIQKGVHVRPYPSKHKKRQPRAFRTCMREFGRQHTWVAFYDTDEFLVLKKHDTVLDFLAHHCAKGSLGINWVIFGTSSQTHYVDSPVTQRFQYHIGTDPHIKSVVKVSDFKSLRSPHWMETKGNRTRRDTSGNWIQGLKIPGTGTMTIFCFTVNAVAGCRLVGACTYLGSIYLSHPRSHRLRST